MLFECLSPSWAHGAFHSPTYFIVLLSNCANIYLETRKWECLSVCVFVSCYNIRPQRNPRKEWKFTFSFPLSRRHCRCCSPAIAFVAILSQPFFLAVNGCVYMLMQNKKKKGGWVRRKEGLRSYSWTIIFPFFMAINLILARISLSLTLCVVVTAATPSFTYVCKGLNSFLENM